MYDVADLYDDYELEKEAQWERWIEGLPTCAICGDPITEDFCYLVDGDYICEDRMNDVYRVSTPREED